MLMAGIVWDSNPTVHYEHSKKSKNQNKSLKERKMSEQKILDSWKRETLFQIYKHRLRTTVRTCNLTKLEMQHQKN